MRKIKFFFLLSLLLLASCSNELPKENDVIDRKENRSYEEISSLLIIWEDRFLQDKELYFVYIFSKSCNHCESFKDEIIYYALDKTLPIYFCEFFDSISICDDLYDMSNCILGTPSLLEIINQEMKDNIAGVSKIRERLSIFINE